MIKTAQVKDLSMRHVYRQPAKTYKTDKLGTLFMAEIVRKCFR